MTALDQIDRRILRELKLDAKQTNLALAERVGLSPSACLRRVQELEKRGVIRGYRAVIDRDLSGVGFLVFVSVGLSDHSKKSLLAFERAMQASPEVVECHVVTGNIEYLLRVEVADIAAYKIFHDDVLGVLPQVSSICSFVAMGSAKDDRA
jgi:Lrp/AsnC family leucine-responsive transcriptional regulator